MLKWKFTMLLRNWLSRKWVATWAGSRLNRIRRLELWWWGTWARRWCRGGERTSSRQVPTWRASMSSFSSLACNCHRKSRRAIHSTWSVRSRLDPSQVCQGHDHQCQVIEIKITMIVVKMTKENVSHPMVRIILTWRPWSATAMTKTTETIAAMIWRGTWVDN